MIDAVFKTDQGIKVYIAKSKISGFGLFAGQDIPWGIKIVEYKGARITQKESDRRCSVYEKINLNCLFELNEKINVDGLENGNESRFINHSERNPNCCVLRDRDRIYILAYSELITAGEELTFDYGSGYFK